jgi:hypothetical protein
MNLQNNYFKSVNLCITEKMYAFCMVKIQPSNSGKRKKNNHLKQPLQEQENMDKLLGMRVYYRG